MAKVPEAAALTNLLRLRRPLVVILHLGAEEEEELHPTSLPLELPPSSFSPLVRLLSFNSAHESFSPLLIPLLEKGNPTTLVRSSPRSLPQMAPIREDTVTDLKDLVAKLETRVRQLEDRLGGDGAKSRTPSQSMRMILMGPPGAGRHPEILCQSAFYSTN